MTENGPPEGPVSEPTLMRFVDGDLPPREHAFVAEIIAAHPEQTHSVRAYRFTREDLPGVFAAALDVPPELMRRCLPASACAARRSGRQRPARVMPGWRVTSPALAASIAVMLGGLSGWLARDAWHSDFAGLNKGMAAPRSLQHALEQTPSGALAQLARDVSVEPMLTFLSQDKEWCRQYRLVYAARVEAKGLACRTADGTWRIDVQSAPKSRQPVAPGAALPAGEGDGSVAVYRDQIMGGEVLTLESEHHLIASEHWRRPQP